MNLLTKTLTGFIYLFATRWVIAESRCLIALTAAAERLESLGVDVSITKKFIDEEHARISGKIDSILLATRLVFWGIVAFVVIVLLLFIGGLIERSS